jgi:hypothetical protein
VTDRIQRHAGVAALVISLLALVGSTTGLASAARTALFGASTKPRPYGLLLLGRNGKFPSSAIPTVKNSSRVGGVAARDVVPLCPAGTADFGTWCLALALYRVPTQDAGMNNYFYASRACAQLGGYLPSASQLIGAADRVKLASVLTDSPSNATVSQDPTTGLKDLREMSSTLVTTAAGSSAAGSEGVSVGATGNPNTGQPNPTPAPADPDPQTLQYVAVYDNYRAGGFAGSEPVGTAENFRCAFSRAPKASSR